MPTRNPPSASAEPTTRDLEAISNNEAIGEGQSERSRANPTSILTRNRSGQDVLEEDDPPSRSFPEFPDRDNPEFPNLENFQDKMSEWPIGKIRKYLRAHKTNLNNRPSAVIQQETELAYQLYEHTVLMLAVVGKVSEKTIRQQL